MREFECDNNKTENVKRINIFIVGVDTNYLIQIFSELIKGIKINKYFFKNTLNVFL